MKPRSLTLPALAALTALLFTAPPQHRAAVAEAAAQSRTPVTRIGQVEAAPGLRLLDAQGMPVENRFASFDHFA